MIEMKFHVSTRLEAMIHQRKVLDDVKDRTWGATLSEVKDHDEVRAHRLWERFIIVRGLSALHAIPEEARAEWLAFLTDPTRHSQDWSCLVGMLDENIIPYTIYDICCHVLENTLR
jgi:hypothetical protein